ncbi:hypothetical protein ElyMa_005848900 [Elysia marginata]|uniref:Uncharacterized protein n=1 Tax=Elysia marginata TaxID=1093978 RepID=A0AAV4G1K3_9GAST|nr:hypothetical protein ElyMa_005848900 [Elysia marginata]
MDGAREKHTASHDSSAVTLNRREAARAQVESPDVSTCHNIYRKHQVRNGSQQPRPVACGEIDTFSIYTCHFLPISLPIIGIT